MLVSAVGDSEAGPGAGLDLEAAQAAELGRLIGQQQDASFARPGLAQQ